MRRTTQFREVRTSHGTLAVEELGTGETSVLFIHGNSSCRSVFRHQLQSQISDAYRLIAFDLPGHGQSGDAPDPARSYSLPGLADAVVELLAAVEVARVVVVGWSLGGHIGIELLPRCPEMAGLFITGTPPIRPGRFVDGFVASPHFQLASRPHLSDIEVDVFAQAMFGAPVEPFLRQAIARTDGAFRQHLFQAGRAGVGTDQRLAVETSPVPLAVVNGANDRFLKLDYLEAISYRNLWNGRCYRLRGVGHAPFWYAPEEFNSLLGGFLVDVS